MGVAVASIFGAAAAKKKGIIISPFLLPFVICKICQEDRGRGRERETMRKLFAHLLEFGKKK